MARGHLRRRAAAARVGPNSVTLWAIARLVGREQPCKPVFYAVQQARLLHLRKTLIPRFRCISILARAPRSSPFVAVGRTPGALPALLHAYFGLVEGPAGPAPSPARLSAAQKRAPFRSLYAAWLPELGDEPALTDAFLVDECLDAMQCAGGPTRTP